MRATLFALLLTCRPAAAYDPAAGRRIYLEHCAVCHGPEGKGDGPAAIRLDPRPRNLASGLFKIRSTPSGSLASVDDVLRTLQRGLPGTAMPSFSGILKMDERRDVAGYILSLPPAKDWQTAAEVSTRPAVAFSPASVARGAALYKKLRCSECHGESGRGDGRSAGLLSGEYGRPARPADLSAPWTFKGGAEPSDIVMRLTAGIDATPMPSFQDQTTLAQRWDLANYIVSLRREPAWQIVPQEYEQKFEAERWKSPLERGRYLAKAMNCGLCHTPTRLEDGAYLEGAELAGGVKIVAYPFGVYYSRNLTPDMKSGIGSWREEDIVRLLKTGTRPDGKRIAFNGMPWAFYAALPDDDLSALAAYLKSMPPVANQVPPSSSFNYMENIGYKLAHVLLGQPATFEVWPGLQPYKPTDVPAARRRAAYYCFFGGVLVILLASGFLLQLSFTRRKRWQQAVALAGAAAVLLLGIAGAVALYLMPPLELLAPEKVVAAVTGGLPFGVPPDQKLMELAKRGRQLTNANCAMCHTAVPMLTPPDARLNLAGGGKVVSPFFGARYTRNLTPDHETGLGDWSLPEIVRAMRSGVTRDGRHIHWLDMPWDRFSNYSDEDLVAIAVYLKSIPAVRHQVPLPDPGAPAEIPAMSIYFGDSGKLLR